MEEMRRYMPLDRLLMVLRPRTEIDLMAALCCLLLLPSPAVAAICHSLSTYLGRDAGDGIRPGARILAVGLNLAADRCGHKTVDLVTQ